MADRNAQTVTDSGLAATAHAASGGGDTVPPDCLLRVFNGGGSPITLTIVTPGTVAGDLAIDDREVAVPAGEARYVKLPPGAPYQNTATGRVDLTWSGTDSVTFEVLK